MKTILTLIVLMLSASPVVFGADLFTENQALKAKLAEQRKQLQPLHQKIQELEVKVKALKITNDLITGKIKTPPREAAPVETVIWNYTLSSPQEYMGRNSYPKFAKNVLDGKSNVLQITGQAGKSNCLVKYFPKKDFERIKGKKITCTVMVKGKDIQKGKGNGMAKFMLMVLCQGRADWPDANIGSGSFDWRQVSLTYNVPLDVRNIAMVIGLQGVAGTVYYKDMKVTMAGR